MSFVFEYFGWTDELMTVGSGFDNSRDRARKYKQWVKFRGPWAPGGGPGSTQEKCVENVHLLFCEFQAECRST